jgi:hypothetical protein
MLINALEAVRRRVKLLGVVYGIGIAVAAACALLLFTPAMVDTARQRMRERGYLTDEDADG